MTSRLDGEHVQREMLLLVDVKHRGSVTAGKRAAGENTNKLTE
jgi:hypothetical protein